MSREVRGKPDRFPHTDGSLLVAHRSSLDSCNSHSGKIDKNLLPITDSRSLECYTGDGFLLPRGSLPAALVFYAPSGTSPWNYSPRVR